MTDFRLQKSIYLKAEKAQVWAFLTDPDKISLWFHRATAPLVTGEAYELFGAESGNRVIWGEVLRSEPHDLLEYTFNVNPLPDVVMTVCWTLETVPGGTLLSLDHHGLSQDESHFVMAVNLDKGWDKHLGKMRATINETAD